MDINSASNCSGFRTTEGLNPAEERRLGRELSRAAALQNPQVFLGMPAIICSESMKKLFQLVQRVARTNTAVLITGETGSGKELVARAIHQYSLRCSKPWVDLNCAALPEHLIESELFGYEKGAFSGAESTKPGMFELAHTGTLFLDEIGELELKTQVKLLRVLDGMPYYRLGGLRKTQVDSRILAATNNNLEEAIRAGRFRGDLFHRLSQIQVRVPPLRERPEDIVALANYFLAQHDSRLSFSPEALSVLQSCAWPGNIRELRNVVIKAAVFTTSSEISACDLPPEVNYSPAPARASSDCTLQGLEQRTIFQVLSRTGGHQQKAADLLGISRRTLIRKLKLYREQGGAMNFPVACC